MVVSQQDWIPNMNLNLWDRFSLFIFVTIVIIIVVVSIQEYLQLSLVETFFSPFMPTRSANNYPPINLIIPTEYEYYKGVNQPLNLKSKTEWTGLEDCERREESATLCSALSFQKYKKDNPDTKLAVIDIIDTLVPVLVVPESSDSFKFDDLKQKMISCGLPGSASNTLLQKLAKERGWVQNRDLIVQEQKADAIQLRHLFEGRAAQLEAVLFMDISPSPILKQLEKISETSWRQIKLESSKQTLDSPLLLIANTSYPSKELLQYGKKVKNPYMYYNLAQVVKMYKLPVHPVTVQEYSKLGFLSVGLT